MKDCVFCRIVKGELPCYKIYEDERYLAFLDIAPFVAGHTLVIPKKHYRWVWDVPQMGEYFSLVGRLVNHYQKVLGDDFVATIIWGLDVAHAHVQILPSPREIKLAWKRDQLTEEKAKILLGKLRFK